MASQALGQSYDCPSVSELTLKDMGEIDWYQTITKHNKAQVMGIILGMYSIGDRLFWQLDFYMNKRPHIDGLVQERCNTSSLAMESRLSCINPSI